MYKLILSAKLVHLADSLTEVHNERLPDDPFEPVEIIVPNRDIARWLTLWLAEKQGIAANLNYYLPSEWYWKQVRIQKPELPDLLPSDINPMTWSIFSILNSEKELDELPSLKKYLEENRGSEEVRRYQFASKISSVFDAYQVYRPWMLKSWEDGGSLPARYSWQAKLWNMLCEQWKKSQDPWFREHRASLFFELSKQISSRNINENGTLFLFNPGLLPRPVSHTLRLLSESVDVFHFDIYSVQEMQKSEIGCYENPLLKELAAEQVEKFRAFDLNVADYMNAVGDMNNTDDMIEAGGNDSFNTVYLDTPHFDRKPETVLQAVQTSVYRDESVAGINEMDDSVQIHCCHSPIREVEVLKNYLAGLFSSKPGLNPDDILVVTPDLERYTPFIEAVFGTAEEGLPEIPYHLPTSLKSEKTGVRRVFRRFLSLLTSRFHRNQILDFLQETAISDRFQLSENNIQQLDTWLKENKVIWGFDEQHRQEFEQFGNTRQTWLEAFRRGWIGELISVEPGTMLDGTLLFSGIESADDKELWSTLHYILSHLYQAKTDINKAKTARQWNETLNRWIQLFFPDQREYEGEIESLCSVINQTMKDIATGGFHDKMNFELIRFALDQKLAMSQSVAGLYCNGIQFQSMVPTRSIPFKVVAIIGLHDEQFPRKTVRSDFDLMSIDPVPGERDRKKEDRNLFLESIMAADDVHYTSYVGKSMKDDEEIPPSSILYTWIYFLSEHTSVAPDDIVAKHNLNAFSPAYFQGNRINSYSEICLDTARRLNDQEKVSGLRVDQLMPDNEELTTGLLSVGNLDYFFANPVRYFFSNRLNVRIPEYGPEEEEEFSLSGLNRYILFQHLFGWVTQGLDNERIENLLIQSGQLPEGWPGLRKLAEMTESVHHAMDELNQRQFKPELNLIDIDISLKEYEIKGLVQTYSKDGNLDLHLSGETGRRVLRSWVKHLYLCLGSEEKEHTTTVYLGFGSKKEKWIRFEYEDKAGKCLNDLVQLYKKGNSTPVNLYIDSGYQYQLSLEKYGDEEKALDTALGTWDNDFTGYSENKDPYLQLLLGTDPKPDKEKLVYYSDQIYKPLFGSMEVL